MSVGQFISLIFIIGLSFHTVANSDSTKGDGLKLMFLGALFVFAQLAINKITGVESTGLVPPTMSDILLVKEIRASTGVLIFGYVFALSGLLATLKSVWNTGADIANQNSDKEEQVEKKSNGAH